MEYREGRGTWEGPAVLCLPLVCLVPAPRLHSSISYWNGIASLPRPQLTFLTWAEWDQLSYEDPSSVTSHSGRGSALWGQNTLTQTKGRGL